MQLKQIQGTSKKTGKNYTAYYIAIGKYHTPLFFPSEIELDYIKNYLRKKSHSAFKNAEDDDLSDDYEDEDEDVDEDE